LKPLKKSRKSKITMMFLLVIVTLSFILLAAFDHSSPNGRSVGESELDYGLVWYGSNRRSQKASSVGINPYFDLQKPTIIFIHGWMPDQVGEPPTFMVDFPTPEQGSTYTLDLAAPWVDADWNIGIFYWHPFSDEEFVWNAEDKIWTPHEEVGMRYRDLDGNYHTEGMPAVSVTQLLLDAYLKAMVDYAGPEIRIAGHSLGNQLAVNLTSDLIDRANAGSVSRNLIPQRIALLDPFWSPFPKSYLDGFETGEVVQNKIEEKILPNDILVEWYHSSLLTESTMIREDIPELKAQVLYAELDPRYCDFLDQVCKHDGAWHIYFLSYASSPPPECIPEENSCTPTGKNGPMAATSNQRIADMMKLPYYWIQAIGPDGIDGRLTPQAEDDWYHRISIDVEME
jgi:uncharacterized protein YjdB